MVETTNDPALHRRFAWPDQTLGALDATASGALVAAAADVALVLDATGLVLDVAFSDPALAKAAYRDWIGQRWSDTVTAETRPKIEDLLREATPQQAMNEANRAIQRLIDR